MTKLYVCPVCGKVSDFASTEAVAEINCGDCLIERLEIVRLRLVEVEAKATNCPGLSVPDLSNVVLFRRSGHEAKH
jgi:hypothetical protein